MPVDTQHPEYQRMQGRWKVMRDCSGGQYAIHTAVQLRRATPIGTAQMDPAGAVVPYESPGTFTVSSKDPQGNGPVGLWPGEAYLPRLHNEQHCDYEARKMRACFFNATARTIEGLTGMLFRKDPVDKVSAVTEPMLDDVTKAGQDLDTLALQATTECLTVGRVGIMADFPQPPASDVPLTIAQVEALNLRPQLKMYKTEQIINWATAWLNNRTVLALVVLQEEYEEAGDDEFVPQCGKQWRVLDLVDLQAVDGSVRTVYRVRIFRKKEYEEAGAKKTRDVVQSEVLPLMNGQPLAFIPFQFIGVTDTVPSPEIPPLLDLAYVNVSHYQSTADVEHGAHKTSLPQPWASGITPSVDLNGNPVEAEFYMGGGDLWTFPSVDTQVGMLEYTGQGLTSLETRLAIKEKQMAVLGARMLEPQKAGVETAETAGLHRAGEQATLSSQGRTISKGLRTALGWFDAWAGGSGDVEYLVNLDFLPAAVDAQKLTALVGAWQAGAMSKDALFEALQRGEVISDARDFEDEEAKIANEGPAPVPPGARAPTPSPTPAPAPAGG